MAKTKTEIISVYRDKNGNIIDWDDPKTEEKVLNALVDTINKIIEIEEKL